MPATSGKPRRTASKRKSAAIPFVNPQLATLTDSAPTGDSWWHEMKYDGYRMQAHTVNNATTLYSRNALDWTKKFPAIADAVNDAFAGRQLVVDGEIVVGLKSSSSFHALQSALSSKDTSAARFMVFDLLYYDNLDIRGLPLTERRAALETVFEDLPGKGRVQLSKVGRGTPAAALQKACARGEEGIICKRHDAPYSSGRGHSWVKVKCGKRQEFVVVGYSEPKGSRTGVGALLLGVYDASKTLRYAGRVGTGFSTTELGELRVQLEKLAVTRTPLHETVDLKTVKESGRVSWVKPKLVAEISFTEWTREGLLRHPVYQGLRADKKPTDVRRESA
ncbi:MAG: hypothetical protein H7Z40_15500 [Phycisphaerae bacterium]|nr:hypothetical protein [Gemmatimonadaceae bacterium]